MARLTDIASYAEAQAEFSPAKLWELFDGDRQHLNIAHECIDRHAGRTNPAVIVARTDGSSETLSFRDISEDSARFANWLAAEGVQPGDRVAIMLEPSRAFYAAVFGTMKRRPLIGWEESPPPPPLSCLAVAPQPVNNSAPAASMPMASFRFLNIDVLPVR